VGSFKQFILLFFLINCTSQVVIEKAPQLSDRRLYICEDKIGLCYNKHVCADNNCKEIKLIEEFFDFRDPPTRIILADMGFTATSRQRFDGPSYSEDLIIQLKDRRLRICLDKPGLCYNEKICVQDAFLFCAKHEIKEKFYSFLDESMRKKLIHMGFTLTANNRFSLISVWYFNISLPHL